MSTVKHKLFKLPLTPNERDKCRWIIQVLGNYNDQKETCGILLAQIKEVDKGISSYGEPKLRLRHVYDHVINEIFNKWKTEYFKHCSKYFLDELNFTINNIEAFGHTEFQIVFSSTIKNMMSGQLDTIIYPEKYNQLSDEELVTRANVIIFPKVLPKFPLNPNELTETQNALVTAWVTQIETIINKDL